MARVSATFTEPGSLGLSFEENVARGGAATIREVKAGTQATAHTQLKTGMALVVVGTSRCDGLGYKDIIGLIRGNPGRPLTLTFEEPLPVPCGQYLVDASHDGSAAGIHHCMASGMVYVDSADDFTGNTALMEAAVLILEGAAGLRVAGAGAEGDHQPGRHEHGGPHDAHDVSVGPRGTNDDFREGGQGPEF